jgi:hypothetical protein
MQLPEGEMTGPEHHEEQSPPAPLSLGPGPEESSAATDSLASAPRAGIWAGSFGARPQPRPASAWSRTGQWVLAAVVTALLAWLTYSRGGWIPILSAFDLGVHEFGHLLTAWAPQLLCSLAGSFLQVAAPLLLGAYFWWRRDHLAVILMVAWSAENLHNVSVYIADAQVMVLPLFGDDGSGAGHDWHTVLLALNALEATEQLAAVIRTASGILFVVALGLAALAFSRARQA